jgi:rubrerythrin
VTRRQFLRFLIRDEKAHLRQAKKLERSDPDQETEAWAVAEMFREIADELKSVQMIVEREIARGLR